MLRVAKKMKVLSAFLAFDGLCVLIEALHIAILSQTLQCFYIKT